MSMEEENIIPTMTGGGDTQVTVPVMVPVTGVPSTTDSGTIPRSTAVHVFYTLRDPRHHDGVLYQQSMMYQQSQLRWGHFNPESTEETYVLTHGPRRDSRFDRGLYEDPGYPLYGATEEAMGHVWITDHMRECSDRRLMKEDYKVDARVEVLEWGQREIKRGFEEVILAIPDMDWESWQSQEFPSRTRGSQFLNQGDWPPNAPKT
ncbi:UNVERIFIED_CONTAM: hypothetical protein K2H54_050658 [Gekko kuhli]